MLLLDTRRTRIKEGSVLQKADMDVVPDFTGFVNYINITDPLPPPPSPPPKKKSYEWAVGLYYWIEASWFFFIFTKQKFSYKVYRWRVKTCSQWKHGCFRARKNVFSLEVLIGIFVDIYENVLISILKFRRWKPLVLYYLFFSIIKHAGFKNSKV